ncbi:MAG: translation initiation factor IF-2 [Eubacteriales bacterium]|nr:translation initiation factor IF-2 [Eubacteriales bacterium]
MSNVKVHELAKELNMTSKELLDKINSMGIEAKSHMSVLTEIDVIAVKNTILRSKSGSETKIVKVKPKKTEVKEEVKVIVKAAVKPSASPVTKTARPASASQRQQNKTHNYQQHAPESSQSANTARRLKGQHQRSDQHTPQQPRPVQEDQSKQERKTAPRAQNLQQKSMQADQQVQQKPAQEAWRAQQVKADPDERKQSRTDSSPKQEEHKQSRTDSSPRQEERKQSRTDSSPRQEEHKQNDAKQDRQTRQPERKEAQKPITDSHSPVVDHNKAPDSKTKEQKQQAGQKPQPKAGQSPSKHQSGKSDQDQQKSSSHKQLQQKSKPSSQQQPQQKFRQGNQQQSKQKQGKGGKQLNAPSNAAVKKTTPPPKPVEPEINLAELPPGTKIIKVPITVAGLADQIEKTTSQVIMTLMKLGIMANINQNLDEETVIVMGEELGVNIVIGKVEKDVVEEGLELFEDKEEELKSRAPIIAVMGHVDHGKTSLLDAIRKTHVTESESGGITQHIGASEVYSKGQKIVFLDTPGHEAFTSMRARGAHATDIAILVVAADDSVKPQTVEAISHARAANVPIIVAINKIDKPGADLARVKQDLTEKGVLIEEWGGDTICVPVSAKTGEGIDSLLEMVLLQAEVMELKANPNRLAKGIVIEARLDKNKGPVASLLVLNGTLQSGMSVVAGTCSGRIKAMTNFKGDSINKAGPATAVEILGLTEVPEAGDEFNAVKEDRIAREIAENRRLKLREEVMARNSSTTLEQLFSQIQEGETKELNLIIKADVQGSVEALTQSLEKLQNENVKVKIIHTAVGTVTESDIMLASTAGAVIIAFNVRPSSVIATMADREGIEIRTYRVIYDAIDEVEAAMKGMLDPVFKEVVLGKIEVRNLFKVPGAGTVAGAYVLEGKVQRNAEIRLVRDGIVIHEGKISSLKRFKDDVKEVSHGYECGIGIENYNDIKERDIIEAFKMEEIERK